MSGMRGVQGRGGHGAPRPGVGVRRPDSYEGRAPSNYVAGLGRGAAGFTTRSDIGPARTPAPGGAPADPDFGEAPKGYVAGRGRGMGELANSQGSGGGGKPPEKKEADYSETNYDKFGGYSERLFGDTPYDHDDEEADRIYEAVDEHMDHKRKRLREVREAKETKKLREDRPKISDQFADLKSKLGGVSQQEWEAIPDVGDYSLKHKQKKRQDHFTPMPDQLVLDSRATRGENQGTLHAIDPTSGAASVWGRATSTLGALGGAGGRESVGGASSTMGGGGMSSISGGLAEARGTVLSMKLDKMSDSVDGQTVVDPKGYLTDLNSMKISSDAEVGDIEKARLLLKSVTSTNPKHGPGWIAAARVEEYAGKTVAARKIMKQGCEACPDSEDVWLEAARLQSSENAKAVLASAVRQLPNSVKIWLQAAELENDVAKKKVVLRRALEFIPSSVKIWKTAIEIEGPEDARIMLGRAVECVPHSVDMWLALARLETYESARKVLNQAREALPTEPAIWLTACKLEEAQDNGGVADRIIGRAIDFLKAEKVVIDRDKWLREAEAAEKEGAPLTCAAVVKSTIHIGVDAEDRKRTWMDDAEACLARGSVETARAIYAYALSVFPTKKSFWKAACSLEKHHGDHKSLSETLARAVSACPKAEELWLMAAKEAWVGGDVEGSRRTLETAFKANPDSEQVWLAAVKLEWENGELERARQLLSKAREEAPSGNTWMKSALLEREVGQTESALAMIDEALKRFPGFYKFYLMGGQCCLILGAEAKAEATAKAARMAAEGGGTEASRATIAAEAQEAEAKCTQRAREYLSSGLRRCPSCLPLWVHAAKLEEGAVGANKARSMLELGRLRNPASPLLWLEAVRLERRAGQLKAAENLMAMALQECPEAGMLWAEEISSVPRAVQKSRSVEALKRCDTDPSVITAVARLLASDRKHSKARKWFNRAVALNPDLGDAWAAFYAFELQHGTSEQAADVLKRCLAAEPRHGELWTNVSKSLPCLKQRWDRATILKKVVVDSFGGSASPASASAATAPAAAAAVGAV